MNECTFSLTMVVSEVGTQAMPNGTSKQILRGAVEGGKYPQHYECDCWSKESRDALASIGVGHTVKVVGELRGRLHEKSGRIYHSLSAEHIEVIGGAVAKPDAPMEGTDAAQGELAGEGLSGDMPF